jgi:hypothetical protein
MVDAGQPLGALHALDYCLHFKIAPPLWVLECINTLCTELVSREKSTLRGRSRGILARFRQDQIDYDRWIAVLSIRDTQKDLAARVKELTEADDPNYRNELGETERYLDWYGKTLERAYECASLTSVSNAYAGSPDTFKRSYMKVEKAYREDEGGRYFFLDWEFLEKFDMRIDPSITTAGSPTTPLYELGI